MYDTEQIGARLKAIEKELEALKSERQDTARRVQTLETGVQGIVDEQALQRRILNDLGTRLGRLTDAATTDRLKLDGLKRDTEEIIVLLGGAAK